MTTVAPLIEVDGGLQPERIDTFGRTSVLFDRPYHWHVTDKTLTLHLGPSASTVAGSLPGITADDPALLATLADVKNRVGCGCDAEIVDAQLLDEAVEVVL